LEIIVADDASPKDPWPDIADLASDKWSYIRHSKNKGGPANFNYLIEKSRGDIFVLHQDDDCLHPDFCSRAEQALLDNPEAVFYSGLMLRGPHATGIMGQDLKTFTGPWLPLDYLNARPHLIQNLDAILMLLFSIPFMHPSVAMRRDVLLQAGGYFEDFMFASDNITLSRLLFHGPAIYDTRISGHFGLHQGNASSTTPLSRQYACRRRQIRMLLPLVENRFPDWSQRLFQILQNLPRRERWKILTEAVEAGYPGKIQEALSRAIGGNVRQNLLRSRIFKASWSQQWKSRQDPC
jgi:glycosyltransferase involved in cell wall biosynthesis